MAEQLWGSPVGFLMLHRRLSPCENLNDAEGILPGKRHLVHARA